ncbi:DEAD/DEAH box helicase [Rhodoglobus sp. NPDC076762]
MAKNFEAVKAGVTAIDQTGNSFEVLADIASMASRDGPTPATAELVIRALAKAEFFADQRDLLMALVREHGLYPYITNLAGEISADDLPLRDAIAMEMHRPDSMDIFFHSVQAQVYQRLVNGENVILSAPTSFGKSLIVDSVIARNKFLNAVIIVPTIALMDETRRRLSKFRNYKIITHPGQSLADRNLFVLTQERYLAIEEMPIPDFFFVDEFYKLDDQDDSSLLTGRSALLNRAISKLLRSGAQFYMAGPSIGSLDALLPGSIQAAFIRTDYSTVVADTVKVDAANDSERKEAVLRIIGATTEPTLIYCQSPKRVREVMRWLTEDRESSLGPGMESAASWIERNYSDSWILPRALRLGIGAHHGRLPRWLAQEIVSGFNVGDLQVLVCTNTLIEGVNTRAKNIIILDRKIATRAYNYFTFANIRGRAGRMLKHFIGTIYLFHKPPHNSLPEVDIPVLTQSEAAPSSLLLSIEPGERSDRTSERLRPILQQELVTEATLRENTGIEPEKQIELARHLLNAPEGTLVSLQWSDAYPSYAQLKSVVSLVWEFLPPEGLQSHGALSASQLTLLVSRASQANGDVAQVIAMFCEKPKYWHSADTIDDRIELAFDFLRFWIDHNLPALVRAVGSIANEILLKRGMAVGNFSAFAARVEAGFQAPMLMTLEEFGIPMNVSKRLIEMIPRYDTLDELLEHLRGLNVASIGSLDSFEKDLVTRALETA